MKHIPFLVLAAISAAVGSAPAGAAPLVLADRGRSDFVIVRSAAASPSEVHAADELQSFLEQISGAKLPIRADAGPVGAHEIMLGNNAHLQTLQHGINLDVLGDEGFTMRIVGPHLVIVGGRLRGTMYGVYTFLEEQLGCRWYSSKVSRIPKRERIEIEGLDDTQVPVLEYREPFEFDSFDADWAARNKANSQSARLDEQRGGKVTYFPFVHTFYNLIPPDEFFATHPEYYSLINGQRTCDAAQLCLTNPDVVRLGIERVRQWIRDHPDVRIISVSQNDCGNPCQCPNCQALVQAEGTEAAPVLNFVNQIADAIADESPNVAIDTLAYSYTRHPPRTMQARPNVIVRLCTIECCFSHPLATDDYAQNVSFRDDIVGWGQHCRRMYIWDYVCSFANYLLPFPNWDVLQPNIEFFANNGVRGIFEEGAYQSPGSELEEMRAYVMAKCLWQPDCDVKAVEDDFLQGYYGAAAPMMRDYIDLLENKVRDDHIHMFIWAGVGEPYLADEVLTEANRLFDEAERAVAGEPDVLHRVKVARLGIQYVALQRGGPAQDEPYRVADGRYGPPPDDAYTRLATDFFATADREGVTLFHEGGPNFEDLRRAITAKSAGHPVVTLENPRLRVEIVPDLGGRIVGLWDKERNANLVDPGAPGDPGYPNCGGYQEALSRSLRGPGATAEYTARPTNEGADRPGCVLSVELPNGLRLERLVSIDPQEPVLTIESAATNTAAEPRRFMLQSDLALNMGAPETATFAAPNMPPELFVVPPEQRQVAEWVAPELPGWPVRLLSRERGVGVEVTVEGSDLYRVGRTAYSFQPAVHLGAVSALREVPAGDRLTQKMTVRLTDAAGALPPGPARQHQADVVEAQDDQFSLYREGELSEFVQDPTASDGFAARQLGSDIEWSIQWNYDPRLFEPDTRYTLYGAMKIDKQGDAGKAFDFGVYDSANAAGVCGGSRNAADLTDDQWTTTEFGTFVPGPQQYVWTAPARNGDNVPWVYVDRFWFEKAE